MDKNRHHLWWPKRNYKSAMAKSFRELSCNIVWIDTTSHQMLHHYSPAPAMPTPHEMAMAVNNHKKGVCSCGGFS